MGLDTLTEAVQENRGTDESMTETTARLQTGDETATQTMARLQGVATEFLDPTISDILVDGFTIDWRAPEDGDPITSYTVEVTDGGTDISGSPFTMLGTDREKVITGLSLDTEYVVVVTASNSDGGDVSGEVNVTTLAA